MVDKDEKEKTKKKKRASFSPLKEDAVSVKDSGESKEKKTPVYKEPTVDKPFSAKASESKKEKEAAEEKSDFVASGAMMVVEEKDGKENIENKEHKKEKTHKQKKEEKQEETKADISDFAPVDSRVDTDISEIEKSSKKNLFILVLIAAVSFVLGFLVAIGIGKILASRQIKSPVTVEQQEESPTPSPTPTPAPEISRKDIILEVLNGSGVSKAASKAASFLKDLGYTVEKTGNAKTSDYTESVLVVSEDTDEKIVEMLVSDLEKEYVLASTSTELDDDSITARFVVGKE